MARSNGIIGKGTVLAYRTLDSSGEYTSFVELTKISKPGQKIGDVDFTHYESPDDYKEYRPAGFKEGGEVNVEGNYVPDTEVAVEDLFGVVAEYQIELPDGALWNFEGYINENGGDIPNEDKVTTTFKIRITGKPTYTEPGAGSGS